MNRKNFWFLIGISWMVATLCSACGVEKLTAVKETEEAASAYDSAEQLTLGAQYLEEIRYEEALAVYNQILQVAGEDADAYLGIAEVYIRQGKYDTALEYAQKGYERTKDNRLLMMTEMIESGNIVDSKNRILRKTAYDENGKVQWWHQYTYDKKGREDVVSHYDADGTLLGEVKCQYDDEGNPIVSFSFFETGELIRDVYEYENNLCVKEESYNLSGEHIGSFGYEYNFERLCTRMNIYSWSGEIEQYYDYIYDKKDRKIRENRYEKSYGTNKYLLFEYILDEYNQMGNCVKESCYDANNHLQEYRINKYDTEGKRISESVYDGEGQLIQEMEID